VGIIPGVFLSGGLTYAQEAEPPTGILTDTAGEVHPWNHLRVNDPPGNFQFAIVTDRTGGHRDGVFEDAVVKLNLLQPEFVVSVGDLIEGYTQDEEQIYREWDEFTGFIDQLQMPFFYVPGNHDYTNEVMAGIWKEKFGPSYYHFIYKDVLFLCLNTEEAVKGSNLGGIEKPQFEYIREVLDANRDVKWTLVFMHQPLWIFDNTRYWKDVEEFLSDRRHTVFVGHHHHYVKYERNNANYFMLATTGGVSKLRGPNFGEFDHMVWVTMTEDGPIIANLLLEGIWDENVVTEELTDMINAHPVKIDPVFVDNGFREGEFRLRITNDANYPMLSIFRFGENKLLRPDILEFRKTIPPNSVEILEIPVSAVKGARLKHIEPISLYAWHLYEYEDGRQIKLDQRFGISPVNKRYIDRAETGILVDGSLKDWPGLPYRAGYESQVKGNTENYQGDFDAHFDFNLTYDDENLYLAMAVWDDRIVLDPKTSVWVQDAVRINLDPRPVQVSSNSSSSDLYDFKYFDLYLSPSFSKSQLPLIEQEGTLPAGTRYSTRKSSEGFNLEISVPMDYIQSLGGENWETIRVNLGYFDRDKESSRTSIWWMPEWTSKENYIGSGMFFRVEGK
jgi:hypothetical protein